MIEFIRYARLVYKKFLSFLLVALSAGMLLPIAFMQPSVDLNMSSSPSKGTYSMANSLSLKLRFGSFDPLVQMPTFPPNFTISQAFTSQPSLYIVQFNSPILAAWRNQLTAAGAKLYDYLPEFAYLVQMNGTTAQNIAKMPYVRWVGPFQPAYKLDFSLLGKSGSMPLIVEAIGDASASTVASAMSRLGATVQNMQVGQPSSDQFIGYQQFSIQASPAILPQLAKLETIVWIEEKAVFKVDNDKASWITQSKTPNQYPIWKMGVTGAGSSPSKDGKVGTEQIIAIADTGLDTGHLDFGGKIFPNGTVFGITNWGAKYGSRDETGTDTSGHGTHVSGTAVGSGAASGGKSPFNNGSLKGVAYGGRVYMQALGPGLEYLNNGPAEPIIELMTEAKKKGAFIQSNSWGSSAAGAYTAYSRDVDQFMWDNKDFLAIYSAGNSGPTMTSIGAPATAKNAMAIGGVVNSAEFGTIYSVGSRGPTRDGRIKPDVLAPATCLTSAKSGTTNEYVCYSGTSMAAPTASGAAALVRDWYINKLNHPKPQAALIKATLIASADYMSSVGENLPQKDQGWGRIWLQKVMLSPTDQDFNFVDDAKGLETGEEYTYTFEVTNSSQPLAVTLAWTDAPAANGASVMLVNDLDLTITAPDGSKYLGNNFTKQFSNKGTTPDRLNNVEGVNIQSPAKGKWTVKVKGYNIPRGRQPFALAVLGMGNSTK